MDAVLSCYIIIGHTQKSSHKYMTATRARMEVLPVRCFRGEVTGLICKLLDVLGLVIALPITNTGRDLLLTPAVSHFVGRLSLQLWTVGSRTVRGCPELFKRELDVGPLVSPPRTASHH